MRLTINYASPELLTAPLNGLFTSSKWQKSCIVSLYSLFFIHMLFQCALWLHLLYLVFVFSMLQNISVMTGNKPDLSCLTINVIWHKHVQLPPWMLSEYICVTFGHSPSTLFIRQKATDGRVIFTLPASLAPRQTPKKAPRRKRKWDTCVPSCNVRIWPRQMCFQDEGFNTPVIRQICFQSRANLQSTYCSDAIIQTVFWIHMALSPLQSARGISILIGFLMGYLWAHPQWKFLSFKLTRLGFSHP